MKCYQLFLLAGAWVIASCKDTKTGNPPIADSAKKNYFPVTDFLKGEIHYVDSLPLAIIKYHIHESAMDSSFIKPDEFNQLAEEFLPAELSPDEFENHFTESSFMDQTMRVVTFTYSAKDRKAGLQRIDVVAKPEQGTNQVMSIYMEKMFMKGNDQVTEKMFWKARRRFLIVTTVSSAGQKPLVSQLKVVWDDRD